MRKDEPLREDIRKITDGEESYTIGEFGVTKIKEAQRYSEFCMITYYEIYMGDKHVADVHKFTSVEYV